ncbi:MAG: two-component system sensor histidine kinase ChiS [Arenicella sp.]|jgi:two-component system sensor histidine kinase ChiS
MLCMYSHPSSATQCNSLFKERKFDQAKQICSQIVEREASSSDRYQWAVLVLFDIAVHEGRIEESYFDILELSRNELSEQMRYELLRRQGNYYRLNRKYEYAYTYYQEASELAEVLNDQEKIAKSLNDLGLISLKKKDYSAAIKNLSESLKIKKSLSNPSLERSTVTNLGLMHYQIGEYQTSLEYYQYAYELIREIGNNRVTDGQLIHLYSYFATAYAKSGDLRQSEYYLELLQQGLSSIVGETAKMLRTVNLIDALIDLNNYKLAERILSRLIGSGTLINQNKAYIYYQYALVNFNIGNLNQSFSYANQSLVQAKEYNTQQYGIELFKLLSDIESARENPMQADGWNLKYHQLKLNELEERSKRDFLNIKHELHIESVRSKLTEEQLRVIALEKQRQSYLFYFLLALSASACVLVIFRYRHKLILKSNQMLRQDINRHKSILKILQEPPVNFSRVFEHLVFPVAVLNSQGKIAYSNFLDTGDTETIESYIKEFDYHMRPIQFSAENFLISFNVSEFKSLASFSHMRIHALFSDQYRVLAFGDEKSDLSIDREKNAIAQFNFYLEHSCVRDSVYVGKLVTDCMSFCIAVWQKVTSSNKVEFADQSKIWKVNIDDGRLRTRSLDRYLSVGTVPKNPRLLLVLKSCHFMLSLEGLTRSDRHQIEYFLNKLTDLLTSTTNSAAKK